MPPEKAIVRSLDAQLVAQRMLTNVQRIRAERVERALSYLPDLFYVVTGHGDLKQVVRLEEQDVWDTILDTTGDWDHPEPDPEDEDE